MPGAIPPVRSIDRDRPFGSSSAPLKAGPPKNFEPVDQHHVTAVEIGAQPPAAEPRLTGIDDDLNLARPAPRDLVETRLAWGTPTEF